MSSNLLFQVGDRVLISKPINPLVPWNNAGMMDKYIGTVQFVSSSNTSTFKISADPKWLFSFDCGQKVSGESEESEGSEDTEDMVETNDGEFIPREDAVLTDLDGWVERDNVARADDGTTMLQGNEHDHEYRYTHDGELHHIGCVYYVDDVDEYYHEDEMG